MKVKNQSGEIIEYDRPNKFKILDCPVCKRQTLMVTTSAKLMNIPMSKKKEVDCDYRWGYSYYFCSSCSKYFEGHGVYSEHDKVNQLFWLTFVSASWDGKAVFNPNNLTEEEWRQSLTDFPVYYLSKGIKIP
jgi:hypothetical protein